MHWWIRGLFSLMTFLAVFLVGEVRNMDMSFGVGHELWLVLGRSVSHKQKSFSLPWESRSWRLMNSLPVFTASFNESYQNQDKIQDFLEWFDTFPWLGDFGFFLLKISCLHCCRKSWERNRLASSGMQKLMANRDATQVTRPQACDRLWYQCEWKDNLIPGSPGWCGVSGSLYPQQAAHWPWSSLLIWFMCDIFEKTEEYFEKPGPGLVYSTCSFSSSVFWDNLRDDKNGSHRMFLLEKRDVLSHSLKLLLCIGNQTWCHS